MLTGQGNRVNPAVVWGDEDTKSDSEQSCGTGFGRGCERRVGKRCRGGFRERCGGKFGNAVTQKGGKGMSPLMVVLQQITSGVITVDVERRHVKP
jgi:hypothetical protein